MNFFKKIGKRIKQDLTGRTVVKTVKSLENIAHALKGGGSSSDSSSAAPQGPQFTDAAVRQAAGAGTVGFTQRTQNY